MPYTDSLPSGLPITPILPRLGEVLAGADECVLEAPPGAGKTTTVPLAMLDAGWLAGQKIIMLEPRRMAARNAALRMASLLGEKVGETVGYRVRLDTQVGPATRIEVITEGILTRMLQSDPSLEGVGLLVFDEFHERSLDSDLGLALALQGRSLYREDTQPLKILVMSATLDGDRVAALLDDAPLLRAEGRAWPVELHYGNRWQPREDVIAPMAQILKRALAETDGSVLAFLPGQREIQQVQQALKGELPDDVSVSPLYGGLPLSEQQRAIEPTAGGQRKVVLATNIAETSLTIDGITTVVDSGLAREPLFDPNTGMTRLKTTRISRASSVQRMGRAGRLGPGHCYRLWAEPQQQELALHSTPEILQADLLPLTLQLAAWGVDDVKELAWLDEPPPGPLAQAHTLLKEFGALRRTAGGGWQLNAHGEAMAALPVHPRLAHMLIVGHGLRLGELACNIAALLGERNPFSEIDLDYRLDVLSGKLACPAPQKAWLKRVQQQAKQYRQLCRDVGSDLKVNLQGIEDDLELDDVDKCPALLACAYPDRVARQRAGSNGVYQLSNGRSAALAEHEPLAASEWLVVAESGGRAGQSQDRIFAALSLSPALFENVLAHQVETKEVAYWDDKRDRFVAETRELIGDLVLGSRPKTDVSPELKGQALLEVVRKRGLQFLPWNKTARQWQARVQLLHEILGGDWPDVSDAHLLASLESWLLPYLDQVSSLSGFSKLDLPAILQGLLPWPLPQQLDQLAPERIEVPSGSRIALDYSQSPPVLAVKLQEMFGCEQTPSIANGKVKLLVHLLSPAQRAIQVTQDLEGFWRSSYQDVRKDMKGRYPKHPWPEDPIGAKATRYTKARSGQ